MGHSNVPRRVPLDQTREGQGILSRVFGALGRKRDAAAAKSGELQPYIMRDRKGRLTTGTKAIPKGACPHWTTVYREDEETGRTERVKVWENHSDCRHPATLGGLGTSVPYQTFKGAGGRKTGLSSFETHKVTVTRGTQKRKRQKARDGKRTQLLPEDMPIMSARD